MTGRVAGEAPRRPRNAAATRAALLAAARARFARDGFDGVGVRDVAADAGVNAALVIRYFGSKEGLFAEAIGGKFDPEALLGGDRARLGERLARYVLSKGEVEGALDPLLALLRSAPSGPAAELLREAVADGFVRPLAARLDGEAAEPRAGLIAAYVLGLAVVRDVIGAGPLATGDTETLVALVAPVLQAYVDGELPMRDDSGGTA